MCAPHVVAVVMAQIRYLAALVHVHAYLIVGWSISEAFAALTLVRTHGVHTLRVRRTWLQLFIYIFYYIHY